jgi:hypothetical protein
MRPRGTLETRRGNMRGKTLQGFVAVLQDGGMMVETIVVQRLPHSIAGLVPVSEGMAHEPIKLGVSAPVGKLTHGDCLKCGSIFALFCRQFNFMNKVSAGHPSQSLAEIPRAVIMIQPVNTGSPGTQINSASPKNGDVYCPGWQRLQIAKPP